jgi:trk system potassium uptake protein TrkA/voltage-gated potassium channel
MAAVVVLSIAGYMRAGWSFSDASYMVALTIYTVGYGEVHPIDTPYLHAVTMGTMVLGCTGMILLTSALVQVFTAMQLRAIFGANRMKNQIEHLERHVIVCGYGRIGVMLAHQLKEAHRPLVVIEKDANKLAEAEAAGHLCLAGDATDEAALISAGIERAEILATVLPNDAANVFITLSARNLNTAVQIIARGEVPTTEAKLRHAGASQVVLPTHIGAERIAEMILYPESAVFIRGSEQMQQTERGLHALGLELEMVTVPDNGALTGAMVGEAERRGGGRFFIVQINRSDGGIVNRPDLGTRIEAGDGVVFIARGGGETAALFAAPAAPVRAGRTTF